MVMLSLIQEWMFLLNWKIGAFFILLYVFFWVGWNLIANCIKSLDDPLPKKSARYPDYILEKEDWHVSMLIRTLPSGFKLADSVEMFLVSHLPKMSKKRLVISLSGGVDSMVLCYLLAQWREKYKYTLHAVHIDYSNRKESQDEAKFIGEWCEYWNIPLLTKTIKEWKRGRDDRTQYEIETRKIRYQTYQDAFVKYDTHPAIIFGHHQGDILENMLTNYFNGRALHDLSVIIPENRVNGVNVWRPMLEHTKKDVYEMAHSLNIPYFKDTTPKWSMRGKMREVIIPAIENSYPGLQTTLYHTSIQSLRLQELLEKDILTTHLQNHVTCNGWGCRINFSAITPNEYLWSMLLSRLFHGQGKRMIKKASVTNLIKAMGERKQGKISVGKGIICYMDTSHSFLYLVWERREYPVQLLKMTTSIHSSNYQGWKIRIKPVSENEASSKMRTFFDPASLIRYYISGDNFILQIGDLRGIRDKQDRRFLNRTATSIPEDIRKEIPWVFPHYCPLINSSMHYVVTLQYVGKEKVNISL